MTSRSDVVIVGAGSAGSVLAERLSADPACRVTVLEAGWAGSHIEPVIRAAGYLPIGPDSPVVHRYRTLLTQEPQRPAFLVRGSTVGGSGAVNGGYFCRALPDDFDSAAVPGWTWRDVVPHYRATTADLDAGEAIGSGKIPIRRTAELCGRSREFTDAAIRTGLRWLPDLNSEPAGVNEPPGVGAVPLNIVDGVRMSPGDVFLRGAAARPNLVLQLGTRAVRVRMDGPRAVGVDAVGPDGSIHLGADRVVLSAGAIGTAHLLMLSGIGPAAILRASDVDALVDLPVGQSCWDHPEWLVQTSEISAGPSDSLPVLEVALAADGLEIRPYTKGFGSMLRAPSSPEPDRLHIGVALMRPRSRSRITLVSADPRVAPRIEHRYDSDVGDIADLRRGHQLLVDVMESKTVLEQPEWSTSQHLCGSAPMGVDSDERAVVDPQCKVLGVEGLWVVDGSVLPGPLSRGPHATIVMLGHRAADFVRGPRRGRGRCREGH